MKKYIISVNYGYGDEVEEIEAESMQEAEKVAYEVWREGAESQAEYRVIGESTQELRDGHL